MKKFAFFSFLIQSINVCYSSVAPVHFTAVTHRPIDVSNTQSYIPQPFTIENDGTEVLVHNVHGDGDCLFYALGITEPPQNFVDLDHPWETKNRTFALTEIIKKRHDFHPSALYKLAHILKSHLDNLDDERLYWCYPNQDNFNLAMAYRMNRAGQLDDFLDDTRQGSRVKAIFDTAMININTELLEVVEKRNESIALLKEILQLKLPGQDLNSYIKEKLNSSFALLTALSIDSHSLEDPSKTRQFKSLCFQAFSFIMSTRLFISDEFCTFLAPTLGKNILVWTRTEQTVIPRTYYPIIDATEEFTEWTGVIDVAFGKRHLQNPNTYHILYDGGHFQVLTSADTVVTYDAEWERTSACAEQPDLSYKPALSFHYDTSEMTEEEQVAAAIANSLKY